MQNEKIKAAHEILRAKAGQIEVDYIRAMEPFLRSLSKSEAVYEKERRRCYDAAESATKAAQDEYDAAVAVSLHGGDND